jgi:hypothetical protein
VLGKVARLLRIVNLYDILTEDGSRDGHDRHEPAGRSAASGSGDGTGGSVIA